MDDRAEWLHEALSHKFNISRWDGIAYKPLEEAKGFMGALYRVSPKWEGEKLVTTVIVKIPTARGPEALEDNCPEALKNQEQTNIVSRIFHRTETYFYTLFSKDRPPVALPEVYFCRDDLSGQLPVVVMEDLGDFKVIDLVLGLNEQQLYAVVNELVKLHFYSLTRNHWREFGVSVVAENSKTSVKPDNMLLEGFPLLTQQFASKLKEQNPEYFGEAVDEILDLLGSGDWERRYKTACHENELLSVISHGDLWTSNMMWDGNQLRAIIDWQLAHCGSIMEDFLKVLVTGTTVKLRRKLTEPLLIHYYEQLKKMFANSNREIPFSFEEILKMYRMTLLYAAASGIFAVGWWSNCYILKDGSKDEENRILELHGRLKDVFDETIAAFKTYDLTAY